MLGGPWHRKGEDFHSPSDRPALTERASLLQLLLLCFEEALELKSHVGGGRCMGWKVGRHNRGDVLKGSEWSE